MGETTISVSQEQKADLIQYRAELERRYGEDISQGEAVRRGARMALRHLERCRGDDG